MDNQTPDIGKQEISHLKAKYASFIALNCNFDLFFSWMQDDSRYLP
jgi:hypothetical protein